MRRLWHRWAVPKKPKTKKVEIDLTELKREDFSSVRNEIIGKGLAKLANAPKKKK